MEPIAVSLESDLTEFSWQTIIEEPGLSENISQKIYTDTDRQMGSKRSANSPKSENADQTTFQALIEKTAEERHSRPISRRKSSSKPRQRANSQVEGLEVPHDN